MRQAFHFELLPRSLMLVGTAFNLVNFWIPVPVLSSDNPSEQALRIGRSMSSVILSSPQMTGALVK